MDHPRLRRSREELAREASELAHVTIDSRQVSRRLEKMLPDRLMVLKRSYQKTHRAGVALRLALADPRYTEHVDELLTVLDTARAARIKYETIVMQINALRSLGLRV